MNPIVIIGSVVPQIALPFIALSLVGVGLKVQLVRTFVQEVLLGSLGVVLGISTALFILGTFNLQPQTQLQTAADIAYETVVYPQVMSPISSVAYTLVAVPYNETVSRTNDYLIYAAHRTKDAWNRFRALISVQLGVSAGDPFRFQEIDLSWDFLFRLIKGGTTLTFTSIAETLRILIDWIITDLTVAPFSDVESWRLPGLLGDYVDTLVKTLVCYVELLRDILYSTLTVTFVSQDCDFCRLAQGRTCSFVGRDLNLGVFVLQAQCPRGQEPLAEPFCFDLIRRFVNCTAQALINAVPIGAAAQLLLDAIAPNVAFSFRQWIFDLENALVCIISLFKTPLFIFLGVVDAALYAVTNGRLGSPCITSVGAVLRLLIGWIFTDPNRSIFNCLGKLLNALTLGEFNNFIDLVFRYLLPFVQEIIDVVERVLGCYFLDSAISDILFSFPGGTFPALFGQAINGPGRCRLTNQFLGINIRLPLVARQGLQTYFLAASECVCNESPGADPIPVSLQFTFCVRVGGETLLSILTVALSLVLDTVICTLMPPLNAAALIAPQLFTELFAIGDIIAQVFRQLNPFKTTSSSVSFCVLAQRMYNILFLLDEFFQRASEPGLFRGVRFVWFIAFNTVRFLVETLVAVFNIIMGIIRSVIEALRQACKAINQIIGVVNNIGKGIANAGRDAGNWVSGAAGTVARWSPFKRGIGKRNIKEINCMNNQGFNKECKLVKPNFNFPPDVTKRNAPPTSPHDVPVYVDERSGREMFNFSRHECVRDFYGAFNCRLIHIGVSTEDFAEQQYREWTRRESIRGAFAESLQRAKSDWENVDAHMHDAAYSTEQHWSTHWAHDSNAAFSSSYKLTEKDRLRGVAAANSFYSVREQFFSHLATDQRKRQQPFRVNVGGREQEEEEEYVYMDEDEYDRYVLENDAFPGESGDDRFTAIHYFRHFSDTLRREMREDNISSDAMMELIVLLKSDEQLIDNGLLPENFFTMVIGDNSSAVVYDNIEDNLAYYRTASREYTRSLQAEGKATPCTVWLQRNPLVLVMNGTEVVGDGSPTDSVGYLFCTLLHGVVLHIRETTHNHTCENVGECMTLWGFLNNVVPYVKAISEEQYAKDVEQYKNEILQRWHDRVWEQGYDSAQESDESDRRDGKRQEQPTADLLQMLMNMPRTGAEMVREVRERHRLAGIPHYSELKRMEARGEPFPWQIFRDKTFDKEKRSERCDSDGEALHESISPLSELFEDDLFSAEQTTKPRAHYSRATLGHVLLKRWTGGGGDDDSERHDESEGGGIIIPSLLNTRRPWHFAHEALLTFAAMVQRQYGTAVAARVLSKAAAQDDDDDSVFEEGKTLSEAVYVAVLDIAYACTQSQLYRYTIGATDWLRRMPTNAELDALAAHPEVQQALGDLEGGLYTRALLRGARVRAVEEVTLHTANMFDRHLRSWDNFRRMADQALDDGERERRRAEALREAEAGFPSLARNNDGDDDDERGVVRHREMRTFLQRTLLDSDDREHAAMTISAADAVDHMMRLARGVQLPHSDLRRVAGVDRFTREWMFGEAPISTEKRSERMQLAAAEMRDKMVELVEGATHRPRLLARQAERLARAAGAHHSPIVQRGLFMAAALRGEVSGEQMACMLRDECGYVADRGVVTREEWQRSQRNIPHSERGLYNVVHLANLQNVLWPEKFVYWSAEDEDEAATGKEKRHYTAPSMFGPGVHQTNLSRGALEAALLRAKLEHHRLQRERVMGTDEPFLWQFVGGAPDSLSMDFTVDYDAEEEEWVARQELLANWTVGDAVRRATALQARADVMGVRQLTVARARALMLVRDAGALYNESDGGRYVQQGNAAGDPVPATGTPAGRSFNATELVVRYFLDPLIDFVFHPNTRQGLLNYLRGLPGSLIGSDTEQWFDTLFTKTIPDYFKRLVRCKRPENYNGTALYSPGCLPLLPEGLLRDILWPTVPNALGALQIPWADELIARDCVKVATTRDTNNPLSSNNLFKYRVQQQCGARTTTSDLPACLQQCCNVQGLCDLSSAATLNSAPANSCLRECCQQTPGCFAIPNCGFKDDVEIGPGVFGVGLDCSMATVEPVCVNACCENGARLCNTSDPTSLMRGDALQCLRFCCNGYPTFGGACPADDGCPASGSCQNFCVERFLPGPTPQLPLVAVSCNLFPECPTFDYCQRLYLSCSEAGYSDVMDVALFITGVVPFSVDLLTNAGISVRSIERVMLIVTFVAVVVLMAPGGPATALLIVPVFLAVALLELVLLWVFAQTFPLNEAATQVPFGLFVATVAAVAFGLPVANVVLATALPKMVRNLALAYFMLSLTLYVMPTVDFKQFLNINGLLLSTAIWTRDTFTFLERVWNFEPLINRLQQFDYVALGRVPNFHIYCNLWAWEPIGLAGMVVGLSPVIGSIGVWALSVAQAAGAFVAAFFSVIISVFVYFTASKTAENADEIEKLAGRVAGIEGSMAADKLPEPKKPMMSTRGGTIQEAHRLFIEPVQKARHRKKKSAGERRRTTNTMEGGGMV